MRWVRILPDRWANTLWPWPSSTRNIPLGSASATVPSRMKVSSLLLVIVAIQSPLWDPTGVVGPVIYTHRAARAGHQPEPQPLQHHNDAIHARPAPLPLAVPLK